MFAQQFQVKLQLMFLLIVMTRRKTGLKEEIWVLYRKGYSDAEIAAIAGCCLGTVARYRPTRTRVNENPDRPTPAEMETLKLIAKGFKVPEIAARKRRGKRTIESQIESLYRKSQTKNNTLLIAWGVQHNYCQYLQTENPIALLQKELEAYREKIIEDAIAAIHDLLSEEYSRIKDDVELLLSTRLEESRNMAIARIQNLAKKN